MEISLYNEDNNEYFGIVDLPDDVSSFIQTTAENYGSTVEDYIRQIIIEFTETDGKFHIIQNDII